VGAGEDGFPSYAVYEISGDLPGGWSLSIESTTESRVTVFGIVESDRVLAAETGQVSYALSDAGIEIFASLTAAGRPLPDGTVWAFLEKNTGSAVELTFDGTGYTGLLPIPDSPGVYLLSVAAAAQDGDLFFNRQVDLVVIITP
jgi:hypothetical protein